MDLASIAKTFEIIEIQFDNAFKNLMTKLDNHYCCHHEKCSSITDSVEYGTDDEEVYQKAEIKEKDQRNDHSGDKNNGENNTRNDVSDDFNENNAENDKNEESLLQLIHLELIQLALSQAKLMTKAFLYAEMAAKYKRKIDYLEKENIQLNLNKQINNDEINLGNDKDKDQSSIKFGNSHLANLIILKSAIDKEINQELLMDEMNKKIDKLKHRYKNIIYGQSLGISYLKKELAGRIQQIYLLDNVDSLLNSMSESDLRKLFTNIDFEITLNRFKTLIRLSETSAQLDTIELTSSDSENEDPDQQSIESNETEKSDSDYEIYNTTIDTNNRTRLENLRAFLMAIGQEISLQNTETKNRNMNYYIKMGQMYFVSIFLEKDRLLGLELIGGEYPETPIIIWRILPDSIATSTMIGCFCPGDILMSVQSIDVTNKTRSETVNIINEYQNNWCRFGVLRIPVKLLTEDYNLEIIHSDPFQINYG